jgi:hypothetical protein
MEAAGDLKGFLIRYVICVEIKACLTGADKLGSTTDRACALEMFECVVAFLSACWRTFDSILCKL